MRSRQGRAARKAKAAQLPSPGWGGSAGWSVARVYPEPGSEVPAMVELVHESGLRVKMVPQEATARTLAGLDPVGRVVGSVLGEVFLAATAAKTPPTASRARRVNAALDLALHALDERTKDELAARSILPGKQPK